MSDRVVVTLHLPLSMHAVGRILSVVAKQFPDAVVAEPAPDGAMRISADPDIATAEARARVRARRSMVQR